MGKKKKKKKNIHEFFFCFKKRRKKQHIIGEGEKKKKKKKVTSPWIFLGNVAYTSFGGDGEGISSRGPGGLCHVQLQREIAQKLIGSEFSGLSAGDNPRSDIGGLPSLPWQRPFWRQ
ncbi:hypothetical protein CEXT_320541 [Caerostris extrusa]|uniref:Uncharacterized protein n=1 Tax=Caerostris extrusa TaxID=172846 RepID=A0AAV4WJY6_CAEEX|nr:hypothetical protein CEXT_320541 [Caerostris extrusa]